MKQYMVDISIVVCILIFFCFVVYIGAETEKRRMDFEKFKIEHKSTGQID